MTKAGWLCPFFVHFLIELRFIDQSGFDRNGLPGSMSDRFQKGCYLFPPDYVWIPNTDPDIVPVGYAVVSAVAQRGLISKRSASKMKAYWI
jgi:hypothetical protein